VGPGFLYLRRKRSPTSLSDSPAQRLLSLRMWPTKKVLRLKNKWRTWSKFGTVRRVLENFPRVLFQQCTCTGGVVWSHVILPSFEQPTPFPHTPFVHCTYTIYFKTLPVDFRERRTFLAFKNRIANRISQVAGLLFSCLSLMTKTNLKKNGWHRTYAIHVFPLTYRRHSQEVDASSARPLYKIGSYFLDATRRSLTNYC
jgi:hypothetical protein